MKTLFTNSSLVAALVLATTATTAFAANDPLVIHEWGTFTSLQDESGAAIGGINTDDEPLPVFVHRAGAIVNPSTEAPHAFTSSKGLPECRPDVTLRLETPVLYFHPPESSTAIRTINLKATFHGGLLTEFYPNAQAGADGNPTNVNSFHALRADTTGTLDWNNLDFGGDWSTGPVSDAQVWTAPRAVKAASVRTKDGETEKFLFYRGVGHLDAPLRVSRDDRAGELILQSQLPPALAGEKGLPVRALWLVDIQRGGRVAFRDVPPVTLTGDGKVLARIPGSFQPSEHTTDNLEKLKTSLHRALVSDGLFDDEAQALLNTWELSYFKSPGLRLFFLVPRAWTDATLPLDISVPAQLNRVMVGRIELVTPEQRAILQQIAQLPHDKLQADASAMRADFDARAKEATTITDLVLGKETLSQFGVSVPASYELYLRLGRFRNALVLNESAAHPSAGLTAFISQFGLQSFQPPTLSGSTAPVAPIAPVASSHAP